MTIRDYTDYILQMNWEITVLAAGPWRIKLVELVYIMSSLFWFSLAMVSFYNVYKVYTVTWNNYGEEQDDLMSESDEMLHDIK